MYVTRVTGAALTEIRDVLRARSATHRRLRDHLAAVLFVTIGLDLVCGLLAFVFERHTKGTQITTFGSALFWTSTQLLTVSSSIQNPISAAGRVLDVAMEAYAITIIAALAGALGSFTLKRAHEVEQHQQTR